MIMMPAQHILSYHLVKVTGVKLILDYEYAVASNAKLKFKEAFEAWSEIN